MSLVTIHPALNSLFDRLRSSAVIDLLLRLLAQQILLNHAPIRKSFRAKMNMLVLELISAIFSAVAVSSNFHVLRIGMCRIAEPNGIRQAFGTPAHWNKDE